MKTTTLILTLAAASLAGSATAAEYVQSSGALAFATEYQGEMFTGQFPGFHTTLEFDPDAPQDGKLDVMIPLSGANTESSERDQTLKSAAFFNVARFAQARYTAEGFRKVGDNEYAADGTLSLRGVSKPVTLSFTWEPGAKPVLDGRARVKRLDFGVGDGDWADTGIIPNEVAVSTRVTFVPAP